MKYFVAAIIVLGLICIAFGVFTPPPPTVTSLRSFEMPFVAIGGTSYSDNDKALITAIETFQKRKSYEDVSALTGYLDANPNSPWKFSLLANLGNIYRKTGYYSKALDAWNEAWVLGKESQDLRTQEQANQVAANLATLLASLGRGDRLQALLAETQRRNVYGSAGVQLGYAEQNLRLIQKQPATSCKCGPYALSCIRSFANKNDANDNLLRDALATPQGFNLTQVRDLSNKLKMNFQMAKRQPGAEFILPCVVHWKSGHFAAILKKQGDFYLTQDPTFGQDMLVTAKALEDEASGYFLVPVGPLPSGWQTASEAEGDMVWGKGPVSSKQVGATTPFDCKNCKTNGKGMAVYSIFLMLNSLSIQDNPVGYVPPVGPDVEFTITYNQLEYSQPASSSAFNFGPQFNCNWLSYINVPTSVGATVVVNTRGGGQETYAYTSYNTTTVSGYVGYYKNEIQSQASLWVTNDLIPRYERHFPDGSKEVFQWLSSSSSPAFIFLTSIVDPQGNPITFSYDSSNRLTTVKDALNFPTTLTYGLAADTSKVTQITDPYGRYATFSYTQAYSGGPYVLTRITDVIGITSSFVYVVPGLYITQMGTPYGATLFATSTGTNTPATQYFNATEPDGSQVHAESITDGTHYPYASEPVPTGHGFSNTVGLLNYRNTYYWDKNAMQATGNNPDGNYGAAYIYHFLHSNLTTESPVVESEKPALDNRIWYNYPNQPGANVEGSSAQPTFVARVTGTSTGTSANSQVWAYEYNNTLNPAAMTATVDPIGRRTNYTYDTTSGIDLTGAYQITATGSDTLSTLVYTGPPHCPTSITDASGQTTTYNYTTQGQVTSITPPTRSGHGAEPTLYGYTSNFLTTITGDMSGAVTTIVPDTLGGRTINRIAQLYDPVATGTGTATLTGTYDALDRITKITYPDTTTQTYSYLNTLTGSIDLDLHSSTDRQTRTTYYAYDSVRHLIKVTDPLGQLTQYGWCSCGSLISITDPKGNITYFNRDLESRLTSKVYPGGTQPPANPDYLYDTLGRVSKYTDKRLDMATYAYNMDNTLSGVTYSLASGTVAPPLIQYSYDAHYPRLTSTGTTTVAGYLGYTYVPAGTLGANKVQSVANNLASTSISATGTFTYDEWGRRVGSNIDGANAQLIAFDSLGRITSVTNLLTPTGSFTYSYFANATPTNRIGTISYPNGQSTVFNYFGITGDERLQEILNLTSTGTLSKLDYTYNPVGTIATWQQQTDSNTPLLATVGYDATDQVNSWVKTNTAMPSPALVTQSYGYDPSGNMNSAGTNGVTRTGTFNALNQLTSSTATGNQTVIFTGVLNVTGTVTVGGNAATVSGLNFSGGAALLTGTISIVPVVATDALGNQKTNKYQVSVPSQVNYSPTYDADGNELTNGAGQTYKWDAKNELAAIIYTAGSNSGNHTEMRYDALGHRIGIIELTGTIVGSGTPTSTKQLVWDGTIPVEERNASNVVQKRFFAQGEQISGSPYYYTSDHLGSVREMTDSSGTIQARYDYDPYGRTTLVSGSNLSDRQYADMYMHQTSGLYLTPYGNTYDSTVGRWIGRDPLGEAASLNLYSYVGNDPINEIDPLGLRPIVDTYKTPQLAGKQAVNDINVKSDVEKVEYAGRVYRNPDGTYSYTVPTTINSPIHSDPGTPSSCPNNVGPYHTHPKVSGYSSPEDFSKGDKDNADAEHAKYPNPEGNPSFLGTPNGDVKEYDPATGKTSTIGSGPHYNPR